MKPLRIKGKKGPQTVEGRARALANLKPCKPGETRNPRGRPTAGASIREWINQMQEWPSAEIDKAADDPNAPANKRAAARVWALAISKFTTAAGSPVAGPYFDRVCDRTEGKPVSTVEINPNVGATGIDYSLMTDDELAEIERIAERIAARHADN